ncbi:10067_t:CDS:2, partial [Gigaspora rosea]
MPFPHNNSHLTVDATTSQLQQPQSNAYSINGVSNHNSSLSSSSLSRNRHKCDWPGYTWSFKRLEHLKRHMITILVNVNIPAPTLDGLSDLLTNDLSNNMSSSSNMSCEMTSSSQTPTLTQDQLDAFHYY